MQNYFSENSFKQPRFIYQVGGPSGGEAPKQKETAETQQQVEITQEEFDQKKEAYDKAYEEVHTALSDAAQNHSSPAVRKKAANLLQKLENAHYTPETSEKFLNPDECDGYLDRVNNILSQYQAAAGVEKAAAEEAGEGEAQAEAGTEKREASKESPEAKLRGTIETARGLGRLPQYMLSLGQLIGLAGKAEDALKTGDAELIARAQGDLDAALKLAYATYSQREKEKGNTPLTLAQLASPPRRAPAAPAAKAEKPKVAAREEQEEEAPKPPTAAFEAPATPPTLAFEPLPKSGEAAPKTAEGPSPAAPEGAKTAPEGEEKPAGQALSWEDMGKILEGATEEQLNADNVRSSIALNIEGNPRASEIVGNILQNSTLVDDDGKYIKDLPHLLEALRAKRGTPEAITDKSMEILCSRIVEPRFPDLEATVRAAITAKAQEDFTAASADKEPGYKTARRITHEGVTWEYGGIKNPDGTVSVGVKKLRIATAPKAEGGAEVAEGGAEAVPVRTDWIKPEDAPADVQEAVARFTENTDNEVLAHYVGKDGSRYYFETYVTQKPGTDEFTSEIRVHKLGPVEEGEAATAEAEGEEGETSETFNWEHAIGVFRDTPEDTLVSKEFQGHFGEYLRDSAEGRAAMQKVLEDYPVQIFAGEGEKKEGVIYQPGGNTEDAVKALQQALLEGKVMKGSMNGLRLAVIGEITTPKAKEGQETRVAEEEEEGGTIKT